MSEQIENKKLSSAAEGLVVRFGMTPENAEEQVIKNKESRRQLWLEKAIDPLAKKHGVSREQLISVLFCDNTEGLTTKDVYWAESSDFVSTTMSESGLKPFNNFGSQLPPAIVSPQIDLPKVGCVLGIPYPDWPDNLTTFSDRKAYQLGVAHGKAVQNHRDGQSAEQLMTVLVQAIESSGFSISGPTDARAAEHDEPAWVCNARSAIAEFVAPKEVSVPIKRGGHVMTETGVIKELNHRLGRLQGQRDTMEALHSGKEAEVIAGAKESWQLVDGSDSIKTYGGKVLGVTAHHVVQSLGKTAAIHHKANLDRVPKKDEMANIVYDGKGHGTVEPRVKAQDKSQSR